MSSNGTIAPLKGVCYFDGGSRGNPGTAGCACVLTIETDPNNPIERTKLLDADETNNVAEYCNTPDAPVVMGDFTIRPIGNVMAGDTVIGWDRPKSGELLEKSRAGKPYRRLVRAKVIASMMREANIVEITLESGEKIQCTEDHLWGTPESASQPNSVLVYRKAKIGRRIFRIFPGDLMRQRHRLITNEESYWAGWLAGMYDGEGHRRHIAQWRDVNPQQHDRIGQALSKLDIPFSFNEGGYDIIGGKEAFFRFVVLCKPAKLDRDDYWVDRMLFPASMRSEKVISIEAIGKSDVVSLQTESDNYNAWGLASKNCGLLLGLRMALARGVTDIQMVSDSKLVVEQVLGAWKIKHPRLLLLCTEARDLSTRFVNAEIMHVRREENKHADRLVTELLDATTGRPRQQVVA